MRPPPDLRSGRISAALVSVALTASAGGLVWVVVAAVLPLVQAN